MTSTLSWCRWAAPASVKGPLSQLTRLTSLALQDVVLQQDLMQDLTAVQQLRRLSLVGTRARQSSTQPALLAQCLSALTQLHTLQVSRMARNAMQFRNPCLISLAGAIPDRCAATRCRRPSSSSDRFNCDAPSISAMPTILPGNSVHYVCRCRPMRRLWRMPSRPPSRRWCFCRRRALGAKAGRPALNSLAPGQHSGCHA